MTAEEAEGVFYECYRAGNWGAVDKPLVQRELRLSCWQAVVEAVEKDYAARVAQRYLAMGARNVQDG